MALARVVTVDVVDANAVILRAVVALLAFVHVELAEAAFPSRMAFTRALIEVASALSVSAVDVVAYMIERAVVDLDAVHLLGEESIRACVVSERELVVERHVEVLADQNVLETAAKAIADENLRLSRSGQKGFQR